MLATGNAHILRGIGQTYFRGISKPDIDDHDYFDHRTVQHGDCEEWARSAAYEESTLSEETRQFAEQWGTTALLVIHRDSILFEEYWEGYGPDKPSNSFSMAKSLTSLSVGAAIRNGELPDVNVLASDYLPWLSESDDAKLTLEHLLQMRSNINFGESYSNPFGYQAKSYYGADLKDLTDDFHVTGQAGTEWWYQGGNTVLINLILEEATGKTLGEYFETNIYARMSTCADADWGLDADAKLEKAFSAVYATPHDFAKIGKLMLDSGKWEGKQLIPLDYFLASVQPVSIPDREGKNVLNYGYQWWLGEIDGHKEIHAQGMRGQYISIVPDLDLIVVRLGHDRPDEMVGLLKKDLNIYLREAMEMMRGNL